jgi:hypothetical protein
MEMYELAFAFWGSAAGFGLGLGAVARLVDALRAAVPAVELISAVHRFARVASG